MKKCNKLKKMVIDRKMCTLCGTCVGICPTQALKYGNEHIEVNEEACIDCGKCNKVCPGNEFDYAYYSKKIFNQDIKNINLDFGYYKEIYKGYSNDNAIRDRASSGGIVTEIILFLLERNVVNGAVVVSESADSNTKFEVKIAKSRQEVIEAAQSKYVLTPTNLILNQLSKLEGKYVFVGLPCQIQGLRKAMEIHKVLREKIYLCISIFCGFNMEKEATDYLIANTKIKKNQIEKIEYRAKYKEKTGFMVTDKNGEKVFFNKHGHVFLNLLYAPMRCVKCFDFTGEFSDVSVGDAWEEEGGCSRIIIRNDKAKEIIYSMREEKLIMLKQSDESNIYTTQNQIIKYKKRGIWTRKRVMKYFPEYNISHAKDNKTVNSILFYLIIIIGHLKIVRLILRKIPLVYLEKISIFMRNKSNKNKI